MNNTVNSQNMNCAQCAAGRIFDNLEWLNSKEAAFYLRKSYGALKVMVHRGHIKSRKFRNRLYFKKIELDELLETSQLTGGV